MSDDAHELAAGWLHAVREGPIAARLQAIYADIASAVADRRPVCTASGRCCNFERAGHRLYVTGLETAYTITRLGAAGWPGASLTGEQLAGALRAGGCPFQVANLCGVHAVRPLGCRAYYCDPAAQEWQHGLYERTFADVRSLHDEHGIPYRYGEWRGMLGMFVEEGAPLSAPRAASPTPYGPASSPGLTVLTQSVRHT